MSETDSHTDIKIGSARNFGLTFSIVFAVFGLWPLVFRTGGIRLIPLTIAAVFLAAALLYPPVLAPLNRLWFKFGLALAKITGPVVMALVYVIAVIPTGLLKQRFGPDPLRLQRQPQARSYWIERDEADSSRSMKRQF